MEPTKLGVVKLDAKRRRCAVQKGVPPSDAAAAECEVVDSSADEVNKHGCLTTHFISKIVDGLSLSQKQFLHNIGFSFLVRVNKYSSTRGSLC